MRMEGAVDVCVGRCRVRIEEHVIQSLSSDLEEGDGVALLQHVHDLAGEAHGVLFGFLKGGKCPCVGQGSSSSGPCRGAGWAGLRWLPRGTDPP